MINEVTAKTLLTRCKSQERWFGILYNMNIYRGCEHRCIYCDSRSECYQIENFDDIIIKANALDLLDKELSSKRIIGTVGTGSMSDPYTTTEKKYNFTGKALEIIAQHRFPVHIITKSDLILKDINTLIKINKLHASVAFTITTSDDYLASIIEPGAPSPSSRFTAMKALADEGIYTGITMMPILPFLEDNEENIRSIVIKAKHHGAKFIIPWFGMSLRDRQRAYFYNKLDTHFPQLSKKYISQYGSNYSCHCNNKQNLKELFYNLCTKHDIVFDMQKVKKYDLDERFAQISLFQ